MRIILLLLLVGLLSLACTKDEEVSCTLEFRFIGLTVKGDSLTEYYTIRNSNLDTLRFDECQSFPEERWYLILDDSYSNTLKNREENFTFIGLINDTVVVDEDYVIGADDCHISRISGENEITL